MSKNKIEEFVRHLTPDEAQTAAEMILSTFGVNSSYKRVLISFINLDAPEYPRFALAYKDEFDKAPAEVRAIFEEAQSGAEDGEAVGIMTENLTDEQKKSLEAYLKGLEDLTAVIAEGGQVDIVAHYLIFVS